MEPITIIKGAAAAAQNKDSIGKIIAVILGIILAPLILILCMLQMICGFSSDGAISTAESFDITSTNIYKSVHELTDEYYKNVEDEMSKMKKKLEEDNTVLELMYDAEGNVILDENGNPMSQEVCSVTVTIELNYVADAYLVAYLTQKKLINSDTGKIDGKAAEKFLDEVFSVTTTETSEDVFLITNECLSIDEIADKYFENDTEKKRFISSCEAYSDFFEVNEVGVVLGNVSVGDINESLMTVPLYLQYSDPWGACTYGDGTIKRTGCCPTCLAMVLSYLRQESIYPDTVAKWAGSTYYVNGVGTSWNIFSPAAKNWEVCCSNIGKNQDKMLEALSKGNPVIASMGKGTFTKGGHFIVLTGVTENGKIKVNDPNDNTTKNHKGKEFEISLIMRESKNMWVFSK